MSRRSSPTSLSPTHPLYSHSSLSAPNTRMNVRTSMVIVQECEDVLGAGLDGGFRYLEAETNSASLKICPLLKLLG
ncbi:hypothetical protein E2C01_095777 [Portunus trituberculatus]|uniref:Uncharacterized protein n=1 Tax=Portunus trituberculatus TaxID=210409 RepID=A0A5B7JW56_PORTR|nr:hypothetical protein [Portunus trituberculatus]